MIEVESLKAVYIDDEPVNLMLVQAYAMDFNLNVKTFESPEEGLEYILSNEIDILYTDYMMPKIDGIELIKRYRKVNSDTPIVVITAVGGDQELKINSLEAGATDFLTKPIELAEFKARSINLLTLRLAQLKLKDRALLLEDEVKKATKEIQQREHESLMILGRAAEYKDAETANHTVRVAHYSRLLAKKYGLDEKTQNIIFHASPFHDIGKVGIPDGILLKEGRLTPDEFTIMKKHVNIGYEILKDTKSLYLIQGGVIALNHHEKYDGSGYPHETIGEDIPICARIVAVADVFDALTSKRPYKNSWSIEEALDLLKEEKGKHFDPRLIDIFIENIDEIKEIHNDFQ